MFGAKIFNFDTTTSKHARKLVVLRLCERQIHRLVEMVGRGDMHQGRLVKFRSMQDYMKQFVKLATLTVIPELSALFARTAEGACAPTIPTVR
jgi:hypothetical protein